MVVYEPTLISLNQRKIILKLKKKKNGDFNFLLELFCLDSIFQVPTSPPPSFCGHLRPFFFLRRRPKRRRRDAMERLLYSPSPTFLKINLNSSLTLLWSGRIDSLKLNFPLPTRHGLKPLGLTFCKNEKPSRSSFCCLSSSNLSSDSIFPSDSLAGSPKLDFLEHFAGKEKVLD